ncbi:MAG TPA: arginine deiminase family protein [Steroidobacteraceae bacterium]|nr:arginine deiminase family protein [Steroidobacteraceae bacterium]
MTFSRAITRIPGANFAKGLTSSRELPPDVGLAVAQHARYCDALRSCGLEVRTLDPDLQHPDSTFVEDTAIVTERVAVVTCPGASSRLGETRAMALVIQEYYANVRRITAPGTLDGGDVCQIENHFLIGLSGRTNAAGAAQLAAILQEHDYTADVVDIRGLAALLHLKSGLAFLGDRRLLLVEGLPIADRLGAFELVEVPVAEAYAANCVRINERVLVPEGYPVTAAKLRRLGYDLLPLEVSEFRKMDGGLSCLSLRF